MVVRDRIQGETLQILILPEALGIVTVFGVMKGPSGAPVNTPASRTSAIIGYPWLLGINGWMPNDFGPVPPTQSYWLLSQDTSAFAPGQWGLEIWTVDAKGVKNVLTSVSFSISASVGNGGSNDLRSTAQIAVEALESYLSTPANMKAGSYKINNRELTRWPLSELRGLLSFWKQQLRNENVRASGRGGVMGKRIEVRT